ncbi:MAG: M24 family metallopeptidase [Erythrobacter sp.]
MDRRQFLAANAVVGAAAAIPTSAIAHPKERPSVMPANPGIDRDRASGIMRRMSLDALVVSRVENVRYATGAVPITTKLGFYDASFAVVPADPAQPVGLLVFQFPYYFSIADTGLNQGVQPVLVASGPTSEPVIFADGPHSKATMREMKRRSATFEAGTIHPDFPTALGATLPSRLLRSGTIGFDTLEAMQLIQQAAPGANLVSGESTIRHMRLIKTAWEVDAMSHAAQVNREACHRAVRSVRLGDTISAVQASYGKHAAALGSQPVFMVVDGVVAENVTEPVRDGTTFLIDGVSSRYGYYGDYGRTVFLGEPRKEIAGKARAIGKAWSQLSSELKPGLKFSEISARGTAILHSIEPSIAVPFGPHSVGLRHTEQPFTGFDGGPLDIALEPGMIISVDCPLMQATDQGTVHLEDLMLITANGSRPIHAVDDQIIVI